MLSDRPLVVVVTGGWALGVRACVRLFRVELCIFFFKRVLWFTVAPRGKKKYALVDGEPDNPPEQEYGTASLSLARSPALPCALRTAPTTVVALQGDR